MKPIRTLSWLFAGAMILTARAAAPNVTPLGSLAASLHGPARLAADAAGNLYVTDPSLGVVLVFNAFGQPVASVGGFAGPLGIAVAGDGRIYLGEAQAGSVTVFDSQWNRLYQLGEGANEFQLPGHLAVDPHSPSTVYISDGVANHVRVFTGATRTGQFGGAGNGSGQFDFPAGIGVTASGEVFVVDQNNDRVEVFTNNVFERQFPLGSSGMFEGPSGRSQALLADNAGRLFVTETMQGAVNVYDAATGNVLGSLGGFGAATGQLNLPLGVTLDKFNRLCVASANNARVELFGVDTFLHLSAQPTSGFATAGGNLVFSVTAGGTNALRFQWQKNGAILAGATNSTLVISNAGAADSGSYAVVVSSASGITTNSAAPVAVLSPPVIWSNPHSLAVRRGADATLAVLASGTALLYQWQFNGVNLAGATNAALLLSDVQAGEAGQYAVEVSNSLGNVISTAASLTVISSPTVMDMVALTPTNQWFQLTMNVDPEFFYALDATTNLIDWQTIANFSGMAGLFEYVDLDSTNYANRFYRLRWAQ